MTRARPILRALGPALARPAAVEIVRAALGAGAGVVGCALLAAMLLGSGDVAVSLLIAPLGATTFLVFCVPNSPLAQPWSVVVGNTLSALSAIIAVMVAPDPSLAVALAVGLAVVAMMLTRAMHPPGGAIALLIALTPSVVERHGFIFALHPVALDSVLLVVLATLFNRATGRKYPFRQPQTEGPHHTHDTLPERRLGLSADDLGRILSRLRLAANIGIEDLARLIGAAEAEATARHLGGLTAADVMSRDIVTASPGDHPHKLTGLFLAHGFKTLPVVGDEGDYLGVLSQADLLGISDESEDADHLMSHGFATVTPETPIAAVLALMSDGQQQAVPVLEGARLAGLVTRTDMIGALAHALSEREL
ncbi:MAG: HPP family protein [Proteobacteria bacterium]|nr:HPP family protein [Pseudomonadota bacterium]MBS0572174.1 HPP family protein [Pseudomonadota bacterium]